MNKCINENFFYIDSLNISNTVSKLYGFSVSENNNKISLKVGNKAVASGELVIINDRFGVRIEKVNDSSSTSADNDEPDAEMEAEEQTQSGEDFDYSDFEVEDGQEG